MKVVVLEVDGLADEPLTDLNGKTPLEQARVPNLDRMAERGILGLSRTIPRGLSPASDVGALSVLGYDPALATGAAALEALGRGVDLGEDDVALRLDLVRLETTDAGVEVLREVVTSVTTDERRLVLDEIARRLGREGLEFVGGSGANAALLVWRRGPAGVRVLSPYDVLGKPVAAALPQGAGAEVLRELIARGREIVRDHPVFVGREDAVPNAIWPWAAGGRGRLDRFPLSAAVVAGADLPRGLGRLAGFDVIDVPGATGGLDTDLRAKVEAGLRALVDHDFVLLHTKAPDAAGHLGSPQRKLEVLERIDAEIVGPLLEGLRQQGGEWRVLVTADHMTSCARRAHVDEPVPFIVYTARDDEKPRGESRRFHERDAREHGIFIPEAHTLMERLLRR
ncbi:MAG: 2,3-bisphosphoglycerate-independent phosphoglycerate mutase [Candidatus Binatia bacterium]